MLAKRLPSILPPLNNDEALEVAALKSLAGQPVNPATLYRRPFRSVNASASAVALLGAKQLGEISLAHHGVCFLDEAVEFNRSTLESLRDPLENGYIDISRATFKHRYPAQFQLLMAMNPCPCGDPDNCRDTPDQIRRYRGKLSAPILDRVDIHCHVPRVPVTELSGQSAGDDSATMRTKVVAARQRQLQRQGKANAWLSAKEIEAVANTSPAAQQLLENAMIKMGLTARGYHRLLKVARSVADLDASETIQPTHMAEAIGYRQLDKWAP